MVADWGRQACDEDRRGCLLTNSMTELGPHDQQIREKVQSVWAALEQMFFDKLQEAASASQLSAQSDPRALARFLVATLQGLIVLSKDKTNRPVIQDSVNVALSVLV